MNEYIYDIWVRPTISLSEEHIDEFPLKFSILERMVFANPISVGDNIRINLPESFGLPGYNLQPKAPLHLGKVLRVNQYVQWGNELASTRLIVEMGEADLRFSKFVKQFNSK